MPRLCQHRPVGVLNISSYAICFQDLCEDPKFTTEGASRYDLDQGDLGVSISLHFISYLNSVMYTVM